MRRFFRTSFGSALLGGAVVAAFAWVAIAAGWIDSNNSDSTTTVATPLSAPIDARESSDTNVVNQIYRNDGQGVAFIEATEAPKETSGLSPFGQPEGEGGGIATGSGFLIDTEG